MLQLRFTTSAKKFIKKHQTSNPVLIKKIGVILVDLLKNPLPNAHKKLVGYPFYRIRLGDHRIIYKFDDQTLYVALIAKRDKVYNFLNKLKC